MDKNELERRLEAAEKQNIGLLDEIKNLKEKLAEMQDEPEIPDFPEFARNETYWYADADLNGVDSGCSLGTIYDDYNVFHAKEMAQEFANKCKLIAMMLHCKWYIDRDYRQDWRDPLERKWQLYYDHDENKMVVGAYSHSDFGVVFSTVEKAQKCADWLNKHWRDCDD